MTRLGTGEAAVVTVEPCVALASRPVGADALTFAPCAALADRPSRTRKADA